VARLDEQEVSAPTPGPDWHELAAQRLDRLRETVVRPLCAPSFLAAASWAVLVAAGLIGSAAESTPRARALVLVAMASTMIAPVCLGVAIVLSVVSTTHRHLGIRARWGIIGAAGCCALFALGLLARHWPEP
jgi:hypothetical protein